jgi:hypothetical protein
MGTLTGSNTILAGTEVFNLSSPAQTDWVQFPQSATAVNRKSGGGSTIGLPTLVGSGLTWSGYADGPTMTWTDGTPTASATALAGGIYSDTMTGTGQGIQIVAPADTTSRTLTIYWAMYSGQGTLTATLSDGSATAYTVSPTATGAGNEKFYSTTITYAANSASQTLTIKMLLTTTQSTSWNVMLHAVKYLAAAGGGTTQNGSYSGSASLTSSAAGSARRAGSRVSNATLTSSAAGRAQRYGQVTSTATLADHIALVPTTYTGSTASTVTLTSLAAGVRGVYGAVASVLASSSTASATLRAAGATMSTVTLSSRATGYVRSTQTARGTVLVKVTATFVQLGAYIAPNPSALYERVPVVDATAFNFSTSFQDTSAAVDDLALAAGKPFSDTVSVTDDVAFAKGPALYDNVPINDSIALAGTKALVDTSTAVDQVTFAATRALTDTVAALDSVVMTSATALADAVAVLDSVAFTFFSPTTVDGRALNAAPLN